MYRARAGGDAARRTLGPAHAARRGRQGRRLEGNRFRQCEPCREEPRHDHPDAAQQRMRPPAGAQDRGDRKGQHQDAAGQAGRDRRFQIGVMGVEGAAAHDVQAGLPGFARDADIADMVEEAVKYVVV